MRGKQSILLVEDDYSFGKVLEKRLIEAGYSVTHVIDGSLGWQEFQKHHFDLCLLDVIVPKKNGYELAKLIRRRNELVPIIFLTAKAEDEDKIRGFKHGGDDYLTKPFPFQELLLRMQVWIKRTQTFNLNKQESFFVGNAKFDFGKKKITNLKGELLSTVTAKEADLIKFLILNANKTLKREEILYHVWGKDDYFLGRSMDVFMAKIRHHLKSIRGAELVTLHGIGFKLLLVQD